MKGFRLALKFSAVTLIFATLLLSVQLKSIPVTASPDTTPDQIAFIRNGNIWLTSLDGADAHQITTWGGYSEPIWAKHAKQLAFVHQFIVQSSQKTAWELGVINLETNQEKIIVPAQLTGWGLFGDYYQYSFPRWSPDDGNLYYIASDGRVQGDFVHKVNLVTLQKDQNFASFNARAIDVSPFDGRIAFTEYFNSYPLGYTLSTVNSDGTQKQNLVPLENEIILASPSFSVDGSRIAFVRGDSFGNFTEISVIQLSSKSQKSYATPVSPFFNSLSWSPNGEILIYELLGLLEFFDLQAGTSNSFIQGKEPSWSPVLASSSGSLDLTVESVSAVQVLENQPLVKGKATAIKAVIKKTGNGWANNITASVSIGSYISTVFYVADQGNMDTYYALRGDNSVYPLVFGTNEETKTIYFFDDHFAPTGNSFQATVKIDAAETIPETVEGNNTNTIDPALAVYETSWGSRLSPEFSIHYFKADWGNLPVWYFNSFYNYSNRFVGSAFPVANSDMVTSKDSNSNYDSTIYRGNDKVFSKNELYTWIARLALEMNVSHPSKSRFVATLPPGWFLNHTIPYTTSLGVNHPMIPSLVLVEALTPQRPNGISTVAHELGHTYKLWTKCEEYDPKCNPAAKDGIGNLASNGMFVSERIPILLNGLTEFNFYCFMGGGKRLQNFEIDTEIPYWIEADDYKFILIRQGKPLINEPISRDKAILARGTISLDGTVTFSDWYSLEEAVPDDLETGSYTFDYRDPGGKLLGTFSFEPAFTSQGGPEVDSPFVFKIPYFENIAEIRLIHDGKTLASKIVSSNTPSVSIIYPNGGEKLSDNTVIRWSASDTDGDALNFVILYSSDGGANWSPIDSVQKTTEYNWDILHLPAGSTYIVKVVATDGFNTKEDTSDIFFTIEGNIYLPIIFKK